MAQKNKESFKYKLVFISIMKNLALQLLNAISQTDVTISTTTTA